MKRVISSAKEWTDMVGEELGVSEYLQINQEIINEFAHATGDTQWIHTDPEKAKTESPFKATIAHGYLTVSLIPTLLDQLYEYNANMTINYAIEKIRFNQAVVVDSSVRLRVTVNEAKNLRGTLKLTLGVTLEIKDQRKPAYTGEVVFLYQ
ncbi:MaoC family dehydratase [Francisellaceae bacterium]|nr:MaoC family dehydratase [Francisellaceae bacterium]